MKKNTQKAKEAQPTKGESMVDVPKKDDRKVNIRLALTVDDDIVVNISMEKVRLKKGLTVRNFCALSKKLIEGFEQDFDTMLDLHPRYHGDGREDDGKTQTVRVRKGRNAVIVDDGKKGGKRKGAAAR